MRLQDRLPDCITVGKKKYKVDFDFRNVLNFMDVMARDDLITGAKYYLALKCVMKPPRDVYKAMEALKGILFPETKKTAERQKITDFLQDADLIRAAFLQAYHINLWHDKLHWLEFSALLACLPEGSRYSEILGIRARPMPKATKYNYDERQWLMKAKAAYALESSDEEREANIGRSIHNIFNGLLEWANRGGHDGG